MSGARLRFTVVLLNPGENEMTFTIPGGDQPGVFVWDYLRLQLADRQLATSR